ncbi:hypothetical protein GPB2148_3377 [marine gamma proteobacterium HTCC2148]|jgi:hypothetical protein|uniref:Uncharacterized protein n=1 Tax=Candidatus Seongchinamella marina TaxID=2518990 RepID=A0ABT3SRG5_9GAMM|nr:hypothetical protein [Candidatus Seongchinamella marina]EEB80558.1 hypothetical protein GPB2148_3377 [marine gamma proteobacterium HTCC2148]MBT5007959.1 hypothetical protein [Halieaceae bacterium]MDG1388748.1 hypothetical protein [Halioglobus sp.]MBT6126726.1 hypothetical protein [Halieaceae bacterium]MBT7720453.1 hypothetical protein [Halieaceae bacterium]
MPERKFEYGPIAGGVYSALISLTFLVAILWPSWLLAYVSGLLFLGLGLRPLLEWSGLLDRYSDMEATLEERFHRKHVNKRRLQIERKERDKKYKHSHYRDPRLPHNW